MTNLYVSSGACSFAAHVTVKELNLPIQVVRVPLRNPDSLIYQISPFGKVPALLTDTKVLITENSSVLTFLADLDPTQRLIAPAGTERRALIQSWLGFLSSEVHSGSFRLINRAAEISLDKNAQEDIRQYGKQNLVNNLEIIERHLNGKDYLVGDELSVADLYLGVFLGWYERIDSEFKNLPTLLKARERFRNLPSVKEALAIEFPVQEAALV